MTAPFQVKSGEKTVYAIVNITPKVEAALNAATNAADLKVAYEAAYAAFSDAGSEIATLVNNQDQMIMSWSAAVADLSEGIPGGPYELALAQMFLHHVEDVRATFLVLLDKEVDDVLGPTGLVPAGGRHVQRLIAGVAEALGAGEADIRQRPPPGEAGDDVAHFHLTPQECSGDEHLLPAGLDGDREALD